MNIDIILEIWLYLLFAFFLGLLFAWFLTILNKKSAIDYLKDKHQKEIDTLTKEATEKGNANFLNLLNDLEHLKTHYTNQANQSLFSSAIDAESIQPIEKTREMISDTEKSEIDFDNIPQLDTPATVTNNFPEFKALDHINK